MVTCIHWEQHVCTRTPYHLCLHRCESSQTCPGTLGQVHGVAPKAVPPTSVAWCMNDVFIEESWVSCTNPASGHVWMWALPRHIPRDQHKLHRIAGVYIYILVPQFCGMSPHNIPHSEVEYVPATSDRQSTQANIAGTSTYKRYSKSKPQLGKSILHVQHKRAASIYFHDPESKGHIFKSPHQQCQSGPKCSRSGPWMPGRLHMCKL